MDRQGSGKQNRDQVERIQEEVIELLSPQAKREITDSPDAERETETADEKDESAETRSDD